jgi:hypothetical protein
MLDDVNTNIEKIKDHSISSIESAKKCKIGEVTEHLKELTKEYSNYRDNGGKMSLSSITGGLPFINIEAAFNVFCNISKKKKGE